VKIPCLHPVPPLLLLMVLGAAPVLADSPGKADWGSLIDPDSQDYARPGEEVSDTELRKTPKPRSEPEREVYPKEREREQTKPARNGGNDSRDDGAELKAYDLANLNKDKGDSGPLRILFSAKEDHIHDPKNRDPELLRSYIVLKEVRNGFDTVFYQVENDLIAGSGRCRLEPAKYSNFRGKRPLVVRLDIESLSYQSSRSVFLKTALYVDGVKYAFDGNNFRLNFKKNAELGGYHLNSFDRYAVRDSVRTKLLNWLITDSDAIARHYFAGSANEGQRGHCARDLKNKARFSLNDE